MATTDILIPVRLAWNGWRAAMVRVDDLEDIRWVHPAGAPRSIVHADVSWTKIAGSELARDCSPTSPQRVLVCVLKHDTPPSVYAELARRAGRLDTAGAA
jgi:hypothetical protein